MSLRVALPAIALLAACAQPGPQPDATTTPTPATGASPAPTPKIQPAPATLSGEWKIVAIDGQDFDEPYGLALSASATEIWWEPHCAGMVRGYAIDGNAIRVGRAPSLGPPPPPGTPPPPVCLIGLPARLPDAVRALDAATRVVRTPSNGVELSGGGHSLLLFSQ